MALMSGSNALTANAEIISNRTGQSGGSVGGVKKAGIVTFGTTWQRGNMGNYLRRAPQKIPSLSYILTHTTRSPVQGTPYQISRRNFLG